ncbi:MAG: hypothetical protein OEY75_08390, partial [Hylemonella sp.]|nr:hypothetical protein [Hylemonella sp.]
MTDMGSIARSSFRPRRKAIPLLVIARPQAVAIHRRVQNNLASGAKWARSRGLPRRCAPRNDGHGQHREILL